MRLPIAGAILLVFGFVAFLGSSITACVIQQPLEPDAGVDAGTDAAALQCDNTGSCDTCQACAGGAAEPGCSTCGFCAEQLAVCEADGNCVSLAECLDEAGFDNDARQTCCLSNPNGIANYNAAADCVFVEACPHDCVGRYYTCAPQ